MKKINILIVLGLFVLLVGAAQPVQAAGLRINHGVQELLTQVQKPIGSVIVAQLNATASKFEGLLNAYSVNGKQNTEKQLFTAASDLSVSLNELNAVLSEVYPDLTEEEQLAVVEAYSSLGLYFEDLVAKTNLVFGREVLQINETRDPEGRVSYYVYELV